MQDDTRYLVDEMKHSSRKRQRIESDGAGASQQQEEQEIDDDENEQKPQQQDKKRNSTMLFPGGIKANWTLSLTPTGLRIDTNIVSLKDLYDILLSGLSQLQIDKRRIETSAGACDPIASPTITVSSGSGDQKQQQQQQSNPLGTPVQETTACDEPTTTPTAETAVVIKHKPLYKSKNVIFPLYSAWESCNNSHDNVSRCHAKATAALLAAQSSSSSDTVPPERLKTNKKCRDIVNNAHHPAVQLPNARLLDELLRIYEECFLCLPLPDIDTFIQKCKNHESCPLLTNAMLSWSARHAAIYHGTFPGQDPNMVGEQYFDAAKFLLKDRFLTPSIETAHALLLLYIYSIGKTGDDRSKAESEAYMFLGLATRMCLSLGLHQEDPRYDPVQREKRRRVFAAAEFLETLCCAHSDMPMLFPLDDEITVQQASAMDHEQGERRYRTEFTVYRHKINQIYRRIQSSISGKKDPLLATVSGLEKELKDWYSGLPSYFHYRVGDKIRRRWTSRSFREQACLKLNFEYHFQMCQLYSIFLPTQPADETSSAIALLSLRLCVDSADAITELLECWSQLCQPWCHFTLDTLVMACLTYSTQLRSDKQDAGMHARRQMRRIAAVLQRSPVKHHKYVRTLIARIETQVREGKNTDITQEFAHQSPPAPASLEEPADQQQAIPPLSTSSSSSSYSCCSSSSSHSIPISSSSTPTAPAVTAHRQRQQQQQQQQQRQQRTSTDPRLRPPQLQHSLAAAAAAAPPPPPSNVVISQDWDVPFASTVSTTPPAPPDVQEWAWSGVSPSPQTAASAFDWAHADLAVNDLLRFADFVYTPTMDLDPAAFVGQPTHHQHNQQSSGNSTDNHVDRNTTAAAGGGGHRNRPQREPSSSSSLSASSILGYQWPSQ